MTLTLPVRRSENPPEVMAERLLERFGRLLQDLADSEEFSELATMPAFQSFVADTEAIYQQHRRLQSEKDAALKSV